MAVLALVILALIVALAVLPQYWVRRVIRRHSGHRPDFSGTGGQFARHLLDGMGLKHVLVEETAASDHYDPDIKAVRLSNNNYYGKSLSAIVIAAHEVGHAMQDATGYRPLQRRTKLARNARKYQTVGSLAVLTAPIIFLLAKSPVLIAAALLCGVVLMSVKIIMHVITLPVEFDASFGRALPLLRDGKFLTEQDLPAARSILKAAAFTYVAAAALSLLDGMRWLRTLRF